MDVNEEVLELTREFENREIDHFSVYIEGFGGFFISRAKDGMVMGYADKNKQLGANDHVTVFFDRHGGLTGLHRKIIDAETDVYMTYNVDYFLSPEGIKKLLQSTQERADEPLYMKALMMLIYRQLNWASKRELHKNAMVLKNSEAQKIGVKPPCLYLRVGFVDRLFLFIYGRIILWLNFATMLRVGEIPSRMFVEQHYPGSQITKRPKKKKNACASRLKM
jgi:hypothetical protein